MKTTLVSFFTIFSITTTLAYTAIGAQKPCHANLTNVFSKIYAENAWEDEESRSGPGSAIKSTELVREAVEHVIGTLNIRSVLDTACGDFGWMSLVDMQGVSYTGMDIVPDLINHLQTRYGKADGSRSFILGDMTRAELPKADLIIARDVLGHLSFASGRRALENYFASGSRWLFTTSFAEDRVNIDIPDGAWRPVNLVGWPYHLGTPVARFREHGHEAGTVFHDKDLVLWDLWSLRR